MLRSLAEQHPATETPAVLEEGELNRYVNVYLNDEDVRVLDGLDTAVGEGDTLVILPAMAGGTLNELRPRRWRMAAARVRVRPVIEPIATDEFERLSKAPAVDQYGYFVEHCVETEQVWTLIDAEDNWAAFGAADEGVMLCVWPHPRFAEACA